MMMTKRKPMVRVTAVAEESIQQKTVVYDGDGDAFSAPYVRPSGVLSLLQGQRHHVFLDLDHLHLYVS